MENVNLNNWVVVCVFFHEGIIEMWFPYLPKGGEWNDIEEKVRGNEGAMFACNLKVEKGLTKMGPRVVVPNAKWPQKEYVKHIVTVTQFKLSLYVIAPSLPQTTNTKKIKKKKGSHWWGEAK